MTPSDIDWSGWQFVGGRKTVLLASNVAVILFRGFEKLEPTVGGIRFGLVTDGVHLTA